MFGIRVYIGLFCYIYKGKSPLTLKNYIFVDVQENYKIQVI